MEPVAVAEPVVVAEPVGGVQTEAPPDLELPSAEPGGSLPGDPEPSGSEPGEPEPPPDPPGQDPPAVPAEAPPPRVRGPLWAKLLIAFGTVLVVLASGTVVAALALVHRYDSAVHHANLLDQTARVPTTAGNVLSHIVGPLNFLLLGSDARANDPIDGQRSDTIIILHIPASMDHAYLLSIPRDLRVPIPPDPDQGFRGSTEKINGAFNYGGGGSAGSSSSPRRSPS